MLLTALIEIGVLAIAFALGVMLSSTVKAVLGIAEEDFRVEVGLLRADVSKLVNDLENRLRHLENRKNEENS
jgi:hypothetical protein